jgi:CheY-like chemotaxis protein
MRTVLLVEDSKLLRVNREHILKKAGYLVVTAADGVEALILAYESQPDPILLDLMLPKLDGASVLRALKSDPVTARIPVVIVTALSEKNERKLLQEGTAAFVEKGLLLTTDEPCCTRSNGSWRAGQSKHASWARLVGVASGVNRLTRGATSAFVNADNKESKRKVASKI